MIFIVISLFVSLSFAKKEKDDIPSLLFSKEGIENVIKLIDENQSKILLLKKSLQTYLNYINQNEMYLKGSESIDEKISFFHKLLEKENEIEINYSEVLNNYKTF